MNGCLVDWFEVKDTGVDGLEVKPTEDDCCWDGWITGWDKVDGGWFEATRFPDLNGFKTTVCTGLVSLSGLAPCWVEMGRILVALWR